MPDPDDLSATLAGIRAAELEATAGPWEVHRSKAIGIRLASDEADWPIAEGFRRAADAEFIAMARTRLPLLLAAVEAALKAADKWAAESARLDRLAENERDPQARIAISLRAQAFEDCAGKVRTAITTALAGKDAGDEKAAT